MKNPCPVCGYEMDEPPKDYNICPSCGTEFGLHDENASIQDLREAWIATGPKWWSPTDPMPPDWNGWQQLIEHKLLFPVSFRISEVKLQTNSVFVEFKTSVA